MQKLARSHYSKTVELQNPVDVPYIVPNPTKWYRIQVVALYWNCLWPHRLALTEESKQRQKRDCPHWRSLVQPVWCTAGVTEVRTDSQFFAVWKSWRGRRGWLTGRWREKKWMISRDSVRQYVTSFRFELFCQHVPFLSAVQVYFSMILLGCLVQLFWGEKSPGTSELKAIFCSSLYLHLVGNFCHYLSWWTIHLRVTFKINPFRFFERSNWCINLYYLYFSFLFYFGYSSGNG